MTNQPKIAIGLGSNIGKREHFLQQAILNLQGLQGLNALTLLKSHIMETPALLPELAPKEWDMAYLNQVIVMGVSEPYLSNPELLLQAIKIIETDIGRVERGRWSPREIDIDIIAIEGLHWQSATLDIPHSRAHERAFVLQPLCSLWADAMLANGLSALENMLQLQDEIYAAEWAIQQSWGVQS